MSSAYSWQSFCEDAVRETNRSQLMVLIRRAAHAAIDTRIEQLKDDHQGSAEERQAITDALAGLRVLKGETNCS